MEGRSYYWNAEFSLMGSKGKRVYKKWRTCSSISTAVYCRYMESIPDGLHSLLENMRRTDILPDFMYQFVSAYQLRNLTEVQTNARTRGPSDRQALPTCTGMSGCQGSFTSADTQTSQQILSKLRDYNVRNFSVLVDWNGPKSLEEPSVI
jgi:hypothetical protein